MIKFPERYSRRRLNTLYREAGIDDKISRLLRKSFCAMANLYGTIRLDDAFEIIAEQNGDTISRDIFLKFAQIARHEEESYYIFGDDEMFTEEKPKASCQKG